MPIEKTRKQLKIEALPQDDNLLAQLVASVTRIERGITAIDELLHVLVTVLTEEEAPAPAVPRLVVAESEHHAGMVPVDARD